jgi:hypothetical protein
VATSLEAMETRSSGPEEADGEGEGAGARQGGRMCVASLFQDDRLTKGILDFLEATEVGRRYE